MSAASDEARTAYDADRIGQWVAEGGLKRLLDEHEVMADRLDAIDGAAEAALPEFSQARLAQAAYDQSLQPHSPDVPLFSESVRGLAESHARLIALVPQLVDARDEVQEKIAYLRRNCMGLPEQELRQKVSAVGEAEWKRGYYWNRLIAEERDRATRAQFALTGLARDVQSLLSDLERAYPDPAPFDTASTTVAFISRGAAR